MAETLIAPVPHNDPILTVSENNTPAQANINDAEVAAVVQEEGTSVKPSVSHTPRVHTPRVIQCDTSVANSHNSSNNNNHHYPLTPSQAQHETEQMTGDVQQQQQPASTAVVHHDIPSVNTSNTTTTHARGASAAPLHLSYSRTLGTTTTGNNNGRPSTATGHPSLLAAASALNNNNKRSLVHIFGTLRTETSNNNNTSTTGALNTRQRRTRMVVQHQALPTAAASEDVAATVTPQYQGDAMDTTPNQHVRPVMKGNTPVTRPILMSTHPITTTNMVSVAAPHKGRRTLLMPSTRPTTATTATTAVHNGKSETVTAGRRSMRPTTTTITNANTNHVTGAMALRRSRTEQLIERTTSHTSGLNGGGGGSGSGRRSALDEPSASRLSRALSCRPMQRHTLTTHAEANVNSTSQANRLQTESHRRPMLLTRPRGRSQSAPRRTTFARHADPTSSEHTSTQKAASRSMSTELMAASHTSAVHGTKPHQDIIHTPLGEHAATNFDNTNGNGSGVAEMTPMTKKLLARAHSVPSSHVLPHTRAFQPRRLRPGRAAPPRKSVNVYLSKYSLVRRVAAELGFDIQESEEELDGYGFNLCWSDTVLPLTRLVRLGNWQRTNHFPAMYLLCRKSHLGRTLGAMRKRLPAQYSFYPRTWMMRCERPHFEDFMHALQQRRRYPFFILKPNAGCQGRGIVVTRDPLHAVEDLDNYVVQEYIGRPMLIDGCKFDLRVYVLLTSIREPSIFLFNDGLVRLCTDPYEPPSDSNARNACMHLTNYAVNKRNEHFVFNTDMEHYAVGNKRNFRFLNEWLTAQGHDPDALWKKVGCIVVKTILAAQPQIRDVYDTCFPGSNEGYTCFEMLGFDILIDSKARPWLMEVNHTPSLSTDTPLDLDIKRRLLREIWNIVDCQATDCQKDFARVRAEFTRRNMPPWATPSSLYLNTNTNNNNTNTTPRNGVNSTTVTNGGGSAMRGGGNGTPGKPAQSAGTAMESSEAAKALSPFAALAAAQELDEHGVPRYITERRASEDSRLHDFTRIYPSPDPEQQRVYDTIRDVAGKNCLWSALPTLRTNSGNIAQYFNYYTTNSQLHTPARVVGSPTMNTNATSGLGTSAGSPGSAFMGSPSGHFAHHSTQNGNSTISSTISTGLNNGHTLIYTHHVLQDRLRRDRNRPTFTSYERIATPQSSLHSSARSATTASSSIAAGPAAQGVAPRTLTYQDLEPEMMRHRRRLDLQLDKHAEAATPTVPADVVTPKKEEEKEEVKGEETVAAADNVQEAEKPNVEETVAVKEETTAQPEGTAPTVSAVVVEEIAIPRPVPLPEATAPLQQQQPPSLTHIITAAPSAPSVKPTITSSVNAESTKLLSLTNTTAAAAALAPPVQTASSAAAITRARSRGHSPRPVINAAAAVTASQMKKEPSKGRDSRSPPHPAMSGAAPTLARSPPQHATPNAVLSIEEVQWLNTLQAQLDQDADADPERSREDSINIDE